MGIVVVGGGLAGAHAVEELRANSGTQFDPRVVEALEACLRENPQKAPDAAPGKPLRVTPESSAAGQIND